MKRFEGQEIVARKLLRVACVCVIDNLIKTYICAFRPCCTLSVDIMWLCECAGVLFHIISVISMQTVLRVPLVVQKFIWKLSSLFIMQFEMQNNATYPEAGYPDRLSPSGKFVKNSTELACLEITGYPTKYSTVLWLLELQIRRGRKVHTVNCNSRTSNCQCSLFSKKNPINRIFCISGCLAVPVNHGKCRYTVRCMNIFK